MREAERWITNRRGIWHVLLVALPLAALAWMPTPACAEGDWEVNPESEIALERGLAWLAANQGAEGNWESNDLGLVSMGALAFLAAGHTSKGGKYAANVDRALEYVLRSAKPSGLLNIANSQRDMYNHGLATFVLGQAYGMSDDQRFGPVLGRALKLIAFTQCEDGGWDYHARRQHRGHDLSLAVMQAKALRGAVDSGLEVPPEVIDQAIQSVRGYYRSRGGRNKRNRADPNEPGQFTYDGGRATVAMAAAGVVCLQEFGQYDDWRIPKNMQAIRAAVQQLKPHRREGQVPFDAYTLYYVGQALYQVGGNDWRDCYPVLRNQLIESQIVEPRDIRRDGSWRDGHHVGGKPGDLYGTAVACFLLAIPNRYLPILQEGKIDSIRKQIKASDNED